MHQFKAGVVTGDQVGHRDAEKLAEFLFVRPGPSLALAKIALSEDPWRLPEKDGAAIARRFRIAIGVETA